MQTLKAKPSLKLHLIVAVVDFILIGALVTTTVNIYATNVNPQLQSKESQN